MIDSPLPNPFPCTMSRTKGFMCIQSFLVKLILKFPEDISFKHVSSDFERSSGPENKCSFASSQDDQLLPFSVQLFEGLILVENL